MHPRSFFAGDEKTLNVTIFTPDNKIALLLLRKPYYLGYTKVRKEKRKRKSEESNKSDIEQELEPRSPSPFSLNFLFIYLFLNL